MEPSALERLAQVARKLSNFPSLEELVQEIVDTAAELTGAEAADLLLYDEGDGMLHYAGVTWCSDHACLETLDRLPIGLQTGVAGWVFRERKPLGAVKSGRDPLVHPEIERQLGWPVASAAGVPLEFRQRPIGVLEALQARGGRFSPSDLEILSTLASMASVSIHNAHMAVQVNRSSLAKTDLERMKADFISIASHELRTPLGVIIGHTALLREIADREMAEPLEVVARNAGLLRDAIENLTALNLLAQNPDSLDIRIISLNQLIRQCVLARESEARADAVALESSLPGREILVSVDSERLLLALNNLVRNALRFTAGTPGGKVTVRLVEKSGWAEVSVEDNGIGIPEPELKKVFDLFTQAERPGRRKYGGMGVGLSTAKRLVEAFGGDMAVDSREGEGSRFRFTLPMASPKS